MTDADKAGEMGSIKKKNFKLFDFFANCEYFEKEFNYDQVLELPKQGPAGKQKPGSPLSASASAPGYVNPNAVDPLAKLNETAIGPDGMKIDRMYFEKFEDKVRQHPAVREQVDKGDFEAAVRYIEKHILDKPEEYYNLEKLRKSLSLDRRLTLREVIEKIFGLIPYFKTRDELLEEEFDRFDSRYLPSSEYFYYAKNVFKAYLTDLDFRHIIDEKEFALLNTHPSGESFKKLPPELRAAIPSYIKDFVSLNRFAA